MSDREVTQQAEPVAWMVNPHPAFQEWWDSLPEDEYDVSDFKKMRRAWNMAERAWHQVEPVADAWAKLLHYPDCWDTAAYPTVHEALDETLACYRCSVCKPEHQAPRKLLTDHEIGQAWSVADGEHNASAPVKRRITRAIEAAHNIKE